MYIALGQIGQGVLDMDAINNMLDTAMKSCAASNDAGLARCFKVTRGAVNNWRKGRAFPDEVTCGRIAQMTGLHLAHVLGVVGEARAKTADAKTVWRRLAQSVAATLAVGVLALPALSAAARASQSGVAVALAPLRIMYRTLRRKLAGRLGLRHESTVLA
jgi:hypothetical protein